MLYYEYIIYFTISYHILYYITISLSPMALQHGVGLGLLQEFPPSFPV